MRTVPLNVSMEDQQRIRPLWDDFLSIDTMFKEFDDEISLKVLKAGLPRLGEVASAAWKKARASAPDDDPVWDEKYLKSYLAWRAAGFLSLAVQYGLASCVNFLLDAGANVNYHFPPIWRSSYGYPPLQDAVQYKRADMAMLLINRGADWKFLDGGRLFAVTLGHSLLFWGMYSNNIDLVKFMLEKGVPIYKESNYLTAYIEALAQGYYEVIALVDAAEGRQLLN